MLKSTYSDSFYKKIYLPAPVYRLHCIVMLEQGLDAEFVCLIAHLESQKG